MCFYEQYRFQCGDWKWGNFRQHCNREYRIGETCGTKLVNATINLPDKCTGCEKIEKKERRLQKACMDLRRWQMEPQKFKASIEKAQDDIRQLNLEVATLKQEKDRRYMTIGNTRRMAP